MKAPGVDLFLLALICAGAASAVYPARVWELAASSPSGPAPRSRFAVCGDGDSDAASRRLFLMGGYDVLYGSAANHSYNDVWFADGVSGAAGPDGWTLATAHAGWDARGGHAAISWQEVLWVIGGRNATAPHSSLADVWKSTDETGTEWALVLASAPFAPRYGHALITDGARLYLYGGRAGAAVSTELWSTTTTSGASWALQAASLPGWLANMHGLVASSYGTVSTFTVAGGEGQATRVRSTDDMHNGPHITASFGPWHASAVPVGATYFGESDELLVAVSNGTHTAMWLSADFGVSFSLETRGEQLPASLSFGANRLFALQRGIGQAPAVLLLDDRLNLTDPGAPAPSFQVWSWGALACPAECANGGSCTPPAIRCTCPEGYTLDDCSALDVNACATDNGGCHPVKSCTHNVGHPPLCSACPTGYTAVPCEVNECEFANGGCEDINECATDNGGCHSSTVCTNTPGGHECGHCPAGYAGFGNDTCPDINECAADNGGCGTQGEGCTNREGGYSCQLFPHRKWARVDSPVAAAYPPRTLAGYATNSRNQSEADHVYVLGGKTEDAGGTLLNDIYGCDTNLNRSWDLITASAAWEPRTWPGVLQFRPGVLWLMGGADLFETAAFSDVWRANFSNLATGWQRVTESAAWGKRYGFQLFADSTDTTMYLHGGITDAAVHKGDVWRSNDGVAWTVLHASAPPSWPSAAAHSALLRQQQQDNWMLVTGTRGGGLISYVHGAYSASEPLTSNSSYTNTSTSTPVDGRALSGAGYIDGYAAVGGGSLKTDFWLTNTSGASWFLEWAHAPWAEAVGGGISNLRFVTLHKYRETRLFALGGHTEFSPNTQVWRWGGDFGCGDTAVSGCDPLVTCSDSGTGGFICGPCPDGHDGTGYTQCVNRDDCASSPCVNGGVCHDGIDSYRCACVNGYVGVNCETDLDECASAPCANGGTCTQHLGFFTCECPAGFSGPSCAQNLDDCASSPCMNGATCVDGVLSWSCLCRPGHAGVRCQTNHDECASNPCGNGGTCVDHSGVFLCVCPKGYRGPLCETDIDECASRPCLKEGTCTDLPGGYVCACKPGFTGRVCQLDINECETQNGGCEHQLCVNVPGTSFCGPHPPPHPHHSSTGTHHSPGTRPAPPVLPFLLLLVLASVILILYHGS